MKRYLLHSSRFYLALSVTAATLAALALFLFLRGVQARMARSGRLVPLVVAARELAPGEVIGPASLRVVDFPEGYLLPGTFTDPTEVTGCLVRAPLGEGEPLLASVLLPPGESGLAHAGLERDFRAFPLPAAAVSFPVGELREGSRVDVLAVHADSVELLLENVEVICVHGDGLGLTEGNGPVAAESSACILLKLTPEEACRLAAARKGGEVELLLRPG
ncbi:MAG: Flp pilus assembly protein CpaB [Actinobacteria bacterium]|nr:Flp pilus assembly protein CpaB [Actinomycetota bacterium]MDI6830912.1 Flp pilus assembly protein CpaB [Actinomycetota bacterium]